MVDDVVAEAERRWKNFDYSKDTGVKRERKVCTACSPPRMSDTGWNPEWTKHCRECGGLGYIERLTLPKECNMQLPNCPIYGDPMCGGWECRRCGRSGPD